MRLGSFRSGDRRRARRRGAASGSPGRARRRADGSTGWPARVASGPGESRARRGASAGPRPRAAERARLLRLRGARRRRRAAARHGDRAGLVPGAGVLLLEPGGDLGPGEPVRRPAATRLLDFELEIAAVIGGRRRAEIAGFTLMNDWSARDVQAGEMTVGLGPRRRRTSPPASARGSSRRTSCPYEDGRLRVERPGRTSTARRSAAASVRPALRVARDRRPRGPGHAAAPGDVLGSGTLHRRLPARARPARG